MDQWQVNPYAAPPELQEPSRHADKRIRLWERLVWEAIGFGAFVFVVLAGLDVVRGNAGPLWSDLGFGVMGAIVAWSLHRMASHRTAVESAVLNGRFPRRRKQHSAVPRAGLEPA